MTGVRIAKDGRAGRVTLARPDALNALTWPMVTAIHAALDDWRADPAVDLILIEGEGRAFCAGGDLREMHARGIAGDHDYGRRFWADEYRLNLAIADYPKPVAAFLHGAVMGGGVGVGCHASHRIVDGSTRVAMPECAIGLVPDVGGSLLLARAPGRLGEHLGLTATRMRAADAIHAGFADAFVADGWEDLKRALCGGGDPSAIADAATDPGPSALAALRPFADAHFDAPDLPAILTVLDASDAPEASGASGAIGSVSPLSAALTLELVRRARADGGLPGALRREYRVTSRLSERGDFVEGIRALIVDKDGAPAWRHPDAASVPPALVADMLSPPPGGDLDLASERTTA